MEEQVQLLNDEDIRADCEGHDRETDREIANGNIVVMFGSPES